MSGYSPRIHTDRTTHPRGPALSQVVAVLLAAWFMISPFVIRYPFTIDGQDASLRDRGFALALLFTGVCWARARRHRHAFLLVYTALATLLVVEAFAYGGGPGGRLGGASWNELVTGALMLVVAAFGWQARTATDADADGGRAA